MNTKRWSGWGLAAILTGVLATVAVAQSSGSLVVFLCGVDTYCSPSGTNGSVATSAKLYKSYSTGILTLIACGRVTNECGCLVVLRDLGTVIEDPETGELLTATKDTQVVLHPPRCRCRCSSCSLVSSAVLVACFDPNQPNGYEPPL